ncbi:DUF3829 domain-containing protein [Citrobacter enshiensis]|uniref:DUF3829 domain-containing protein n=1 Tax=Citrobacter enshiensis TaxID=2971264 RepID=UPI0023E8F0CD|nr:DUF3829 domain-containing protein [Citrobacter enshiensis]WET42204.1 DUF3829 domain-containing protein [Citrobacter enshiensis]
MKRINIFTLSIIFTSIGLIGCDNNNDESISTTTIAQQPSSLIQPKVITPDQLNADKIYREKMRIYIGCINHLQPEFDRSFIHYHSWIKDLQHGPTGNESPGAGISEISDNHLSDCDKKISQVHTLIATPESIDTLAIDYMRRATALAAKISEIRVYYKQENYKDDGFIKGKALHGEWLKYHVPFETVANDWYAAIQKQVDEQHQKTLTEEEIVAQKNFRYYALKTTMIAQEIQKNVTMGSVDVDALKEKTSALDTLIAKLKATDEEGRESLFIYETQNLQTQAIKYARRMKEPTPYTRSEKMRIEGMDMGYTVDGSCPAVQDKYNSVVDQYNWLTPDDGDNFLFTRAHCDE